ncbi:hypothetical protein NQ318_005705 [Aromia moschata]|uniref:Small acidic protein-like domain-containing protein n=1 Tax=Aromia moschata TaxID=1265417 RepID=A0AAV8XLJ7_9CUCU|nr:hypothetical protein NQ318_005705 [Aromia moschata]
MNSLLSYGSDDDYDDSSEEKQTDSYAPSSKTYRKFGTPKQEDVNYDEVQMSLSEDSDGEDQQAPKQPKEAPRARDESRWDSREERGGSRPRDDHRRKDRRDERYGGRNEREEDRTARHREGREEERGARERYRPEKEEDRPKEKRDDRRGKSKERYSNKDDRYRDRGDRDRRERERRRSRSPRDRDRRRSRSPRRSRSRSKDRGGRGGYSKRYDRASAKMERLEKMDMQYQQHPAAAPQQRAGEPGDNGAKDRFFMPGITGRFRDQIEKRKLLWQKKAPERQETVVAPAALPAGPRATKGKVANKFKRLMGIKSVGEGSNTAADVLKKQEEMFSSMEQQYEVARTATHTMRGVGLGFGSYQR